MVSSPSIRFESIFLVVGEILFCGYTYLTPLLLPFLSKFFFDIFFIFLKSFQTSDGKILSNLSRGILLSLFLKLGFLIFFVSNNSSHSDSLIG